MNARTLIMKLTPDGVVTVLARPTLTIGSLSGPTIDDPAPSAHPAGEPPLVVEQGAA